jgi:hypothetical protein
MLPWLAMAYWPLGCVYVPIGVCISNLNIGFRMCQHTQLMHHYALLGYMHLRLIYEILFATC